MKRPSWAGLACASAFLVAGAASATTTRLFRQTTAKDFEEGEATATTVAPPGEVLPGMKSTRVVIDAAFAWCAALSRDRGTAYFGTGDRGRIFALGAAGTDGTKLLATIDAPWVTALAVRPDGSLLAGSTPGGRIFAVDAKTGKNSVFAKLGAEHVWAIEHDAARATTYAATGDSGKIFAIDAKGNARLLWDSGDKHVMSLAKDGDALLAGTADKAMVYRVHKDGRAEALHDFDADEVRSIVRAKGAIYLAVNDFDNPADAKDPAPVGAQAAKGTRIVAGPAPASGAIARTDAVKAKAAIYRLDDDGRIEQLFALADGYFTTLLLDGQGNLLAAAGSQGKIYRIAPDRTVALAADISERQALSMVQTREGFLVGSGDIGAIYRVRPAQGAEATYLSKVLDAETPARWGHVWWTGSRDLVLETRSGNTGKPDASWSAFHHLADVAHPGGEHGGENAGSIRSPGGRYLQYRATLPGRDSVLKDISIYYAPHNQRARITEVFLGDAPMPPAPAAGGIAAIAAPSAGSARVHSSTLKLRWKVENPDNDELIYKLWFRQEGDAVWRSLGGPDSLSKPEYDWNTDSVPDGRYLIRVWASDEKVTAADRALDHQFESQPFLVDNTKPEILGLAARSGTAVGRAHDAASVISAIEFAVDGGEWRPAQPDDGLLDERDEAFTIGLSKALAPGPHIINVRAWDSADNVGSARIEIRVGK
jgi:outer membrane protein assembly factor BamB